MPTEIRRIVTVTDDDGKAVVQYDGPAPTVIETSPFVTVSNLWITDHFPLPVDDQNDLGKTKVPRQPPAGHTIFRTVEFKPGNTRDMHVTNSIDFAIVISGEVELELDDGVKLSMKTGDTLVQQANIHGWNNVGTVPCLIAFVLVSTED
jgi:quercetin dioxygenase-like cupin family protein